MASVVQILCCLLLIGTTSVVLGEVVDEESGESPSNGMSDKHRPRPTDSHGSPCPKDDKDCIMSNWPTDDTGSHIKPSKPSSKPVDNDDGTSDKHRPRPTDSHGSPCPKDDKDCIMSNWPTDDTGSHIKPSKPSSKPVDNNDGMSRHIHSTIESTLGESIVTIANAEEFLESEDGHSLSVMYSAIIAIFGVAAVAAIIGTAYVIHRRKNNSRPKDDAFVMGIENKLYDSSSTTTTVSPC